MFESSFDSRTTPAPASHRKCSADQPMGRHPMPSSLTAPVRVAPPPVSNPAARNQLCSENDGTPTSLSCFPSMKLLRKKLPSPSRMKSLLSSGVVREKNTTTRHDYASSSCPPPMCEGEYVPPPGPQSNVRLPSSRGKRGGDDHFPTSAPPSRIEARDEGR